MPSMTFKKTLAVAVLTGSLAALPVAGFAAEAAKAAPAKEMKATAKKVHHKMHVSEAVKKAQEALNKEGAKLAVDGVMGHKTRLAIKAFQKAHKLKATGYLDKATRKALKV